jgi:plasmid stability protein
MAMLTVRNLPDDVHRALRLLAAENGVSTEAAVRNLITVAVKPASRLLMGDAMAALSREAGVTRQDIQALEKKLNKSPAEPMVFK